MSHVVRTSIEIDAAASEVWDILIDLDRYGEWNPFIVRARGRIAPGATVEVCPSAARDRQVEFRPTVTNYQEQREFTWTGAFLHPRFALGDHTFRLAPLGGGRIRLDHDERIYGIGAPLVWLLAKEEIRAGFEAMNLALKRRAEGRAPG